MDNPAFRDGGDMFQEEQLSNLKIILKFCQQDQQEVFIVGGAIRDYLAGKEFNDIDLVLNRRVAETARYFADVTSGHLVILDQERKIYRVVQPEGSYDFTQLKGKKIEDDLRERDFTVNAMAYPLALLMFKVSGINRSNLIDPYAGWPDLQQRTLRVVTTGVFKHDPLRLWRGLRLMGSLALDFDPPTAKIIIQQATLCSRPAAERIRQELVQIFSLPNTAELIRLGEERFALFSNLIPLIRVMKKTGQNSYHHEDLWTHTILVLEKLEQLLADQERLTDLISAQFPLQLLYLIKIAAFLHDIGKTESRQEKDGQVHYYGHEKSGARLARQLLQRCRFGKKEIKTVETLVSLHMRPLYLSLAEQLTERGLYRFFREAGDLTPAVLLLSLADQSAGRELNQREEGIPAYRRYMIELAQKYQLIRQRGSSLLLSGQELQEIFFLEEGPQIGRLLEKLKEAQALDRVRTKSEAINYLRKMVRTEYS